MAELIDTYVEIRSKHSDLLGGTGFEDSIIDVFEPSQYVVDLFNAARDKQ